MRVFRVQNEAGIGMYRASDYACTELSELSSRHPLPQMDDALMAALEEDSECYGGKMFAFVSREQLKFWLYRDEDRAAVAKEGCKVYEMETDAVWVGDTQCVYSKGSERVIAVHELTKI